MIKFGSFYLAKPGLDQQAGLGDESAAETGRLLLDCARKSPLVSRIIDEGMADASWAFEVSDDERTGTAVGILGHVVFRVNWPARNWSALSDEPVPEQLIIAVNGVNYAVAAEIHTSPPFEDSFEMGRQAQACLDEIYASVPDHFIYRIGPTPMFLTVYLTHTPGTKKRSTKSLDEDDVAIRITDDDAANIEDFLIEVISRDADWAVVEHYGALLERVAFIRQDIELTDAIDTCFELQKRLWAARGLSPQKLWARNTIRGALREALGRLYRAHTEASDNVNTLRRTVRESKNSFTKLYIFAHCPDYTQRDVEDILDWDDSHLLQAARFIEDDLRSNSLEQVTVTAAIAGAIAGAVIVGIIQVA